MGGAVYFRDGTGNVIKVDVDNPLPISDSGAVQTSTMGQPGGPAGPLDQNGEIPLAQIPIDGINFKGAWDASTNTPTLADGTGTAGDLYRVSVAGTQDLGSGPLTFEVGDHVIFEGSVWQQFSPPPAMAWGDITGTLANQTDLQTALDAKLDTADQAVVRTSGTVQLQLDGEDLIWPVDVSTGKIRLFNSTPASANQYYGFGIDNHIFVYQVDTPVADHVFFAADGDDNRVELFRVHGDKSVTAQGDLHMSEQRVVNLGAPTADKDAANKSYVDTAVAAAGGPPVAPITHTSTLVSLASDAAPVHLIDTTAGDVDVKLPAAGTPAGKTITIKRTTGGANGLDISSTDVTPTIDGTAIQGLSDQYSFKTVVYDGTDWWITAAEGN